MLTKKAKITLNKHSIEALNRPEGWDIFDGDQELSIRKIKVASVTKDTDLNGFDLTAAVKKNPDHLFVKVFAIKKDEINDNGDAFTEEELKKSAHTFIGCPVFCNHQNDDIEKARGKVVHAWYDDEKGGIYIISMVDKVAYPKLARGIEEGYINGSSMGTQVSHSTCSLCHNCASVSDQYCSHVKNQKTRKFSGKVKCEYHKSKHKPYDKCPVCGCAEGEEKIHEFKESVVHERNYGLKFIEDSFVVNPACHDCLVDCILNVPAYEKAAAAAKVAFEKIANYKNTNKLVKTAGAAELNLLSQSMKFMEIVAKSMMDQKESVSMEYVSDIVEVLADTQTLTDELIEMGYGQLQSPPTLQKPDQIVDAISPNSIGQQVSSNNLTPSVNPQGNAIFPQNTTVNNQNFNNTPDLGSVTKPTFSPTADKKIKEFSKYSANIDQRVLRLSKIVEKYKKNKEDNVDFILSKNGITVKANKAENGINLLAFIGDNEVEGEKLAFYRENDKTFWNDADKAALEIINDIDKIASVLTKTKDSGEKNMSTKTASSVITEKQLDESKADLGKREGTYPEVIIESHLDGKEEFKDVTTESGQVRKDSYPTYIIEKQLEKDIKESEVARWDSYPEVITEKQWTDFSRAVGAVLTEKQENHITDAQLADLLKNHRWVNLDVITEKQLGDTKNWLSDEFAWKDKKTANSYALALTTAAKNALTDAIAIYKRTPTEIANAIKQITKDPQSQIKAAFLVLVNGMPTKVASRKNEIERLNYFSKVSSTVPSVSAVDSVIACMGDNCNNLKAEDLIEAVRVLASNSEKLNKIEVLAHNKIKNPVVAESNIIDKTAEIENAFNAIFAETEEDKKDEEKAEEEQEKFEKEEKGEEKEASVEDGLYQIRSTIDEIGISIEDKVAFTKAAEKFAQSQINNKDAVLYTIEIDEDNGSVFTTLKESSKLTPEEALSYEKFASSNKKALRKNLLKEAQMMGGEQPAGPGNPGAGPVGASVPQAGGPAGVPPIESLEGGDEPSESDGEKPKPPGTICPVCGTQDVDVVAGKGKCNNPECGSEYTVKVNLEVTKYKGVTDTGSEGKSEGKLEEPEGFDMPGNETPTMPLAAMTRISPEQIRRLSSSNKNYKVGKISPLTGTTNTLHIAKNKDSQGFLFDTYLCLDTGAKYSVHSKIDKNNPKSIAYEWRWTPKVAGRDCATCNRTKLAFAKAIKEFGITEEAFDSYSIKEKASTILAMSDKGLFNLVKTANKNGSIISDYKKAYTVEKFPYQECLAKVANRYGIDAISLSGPNKGENLSKCVCDSLKSLHAYTDNLALKVASAWQDKDGCLECIEDHVREFGYDLEKSANICQKLKLKYASNIELFAEALSDNMSNHSQPASSSSGDNNTTPAPVGGLGKKNPSMCKKDNGGMGGLSDLVDSFDNAHEHNDDTVEIELDGDIADNVSLDQKEDTITIELPFEAVKALDTALDTVLGPSDEDNLNPNEDNSDEIVEIEDNNEGETDVDVELPLEDSSIEVEDEGSSEENSEEDSEEETSDFKHHEDKEPNMPENKEYKEGEESEKLASYMRKGKQNKTGEINLDLSGVVNFLKKQAGEVEPKVTPAQDVFKDYKGSDGSVQGGESKFDAKKPVVETGDASMGNENKLELKLPKLPKASGDEANLEGEKHYKSEKDLDISGGAGGAGKSQTAATKSTKKIAEKAKVNNPQDAFKDQQGEFANGKDLAESGNPRAGYKKNENKFDFPEGGDSALFEHEKESLGSVPKFENSAPEIPTSGKLLDKEKNEKNKPSLTNDIKGFAANNGEKSKVVAEAFRIAGRMVEARKIEASQLKNKVEELSRYEFNILQDIEKAIFANNSQKGLVTEPDGVEQTVPIISEAASDKNESLVEKLSSLFTLNKNNSKALEDEAELRKAYNK